MLILFIFVSFLIDRLVSFFLLWLLLLGLIRFTKMFVFFTLLDFITLRLILFFYLGLFFAVRISILDFVKGDYIEVVWPVLYRRFTCVWARFEVDELHRALFVPSEVGDRVSVEELNSS